MFRLEAFRQRDAGLRLRRQVHVKHRVARIAIKMAVLAHVRAEPGGAAIQRHLSGEPALYQCIKAVVNRGHGNIRHGLFGPDEDLLGGRVIALLDEHVIDLLPLRCEMETARGEPLIQIAARFFLFDQVHGTGKLAQPIRPVNS